MAQAAFIKSYSFTSGTVTDPEEVPGSGSYALQTDSSGSGSLTGYSMHLEGSLDGVNWFSIVAQTQTGARLAWAVGKPVKYIRVGAGISGTDLLVTATVLAV